MVSRKERKEEAEKKSRQVRAFVLIRFKELIDIGLLSVPQIVDQLAAEVEAHVKKCPQERALIEKVAIATVKEVLDRATGITKEDNVASTVSD